MNLTKTISKRRLLLVTLAGLVLCVAIVFYLSLKNRHFNNPVPIAVSTATLHKPEKINSGFPVRLKIPTINVDAASDYVGLTPGGDLDTPKGPVNAGWYDHGPRPGEMGSSVINGHFGYKNNIPAVFDNLHKLQVGDKLYIEDERGTTITFAVRKLSTYSQNEDHSDVFRSSDGQAHLNLITCQGVWKDEQSSRN